MTDQSMTPEQTCVRGLELAERFISYMIPGHRYTVETMCGNSFWDPLDNYLRQKVGEAIALAVSRGDLNLRPSFKGGKATNMYELPYDVAERDPATDIDANTITIINPKIVVGKN